MGDDLTITTVEEVEEIVHFRTQEMNKADRIHESATAEENMIFGSGKPPPKGVGYRVEYRHATSEQVVHSIRTDRLDFEAIDGYGEVFDIVTTFLTPDKEFRTGKDSEGRSTRATPLVTDTRRKVNMHIYSPAIIHALRSVVKYYPDQNLMGETVIIPAPYAILVHHEKELNDYKEKYHPSLLEEPICPKEKKAYEDIQLLQVFLKQTIMPQVELERERNRKGLETWDMLWLRRRPGATFKIHLVGINSGWTTGVIEGLRNGTVGFGGIPWTVDYWCLDYNGNCLGTLKRCFGRDRFEGEKEIRNELIIPDSAFEEPFDESVRKFVERGEKCLKLLSKQCQYYKGTTFNFPHQQIDGLVMIDMKKYYSDVDSKLKIPTRPVVTQFQPVRPWVTDCSCVVCRRRKDESTQLDQTLESFGDYHGIYPENWKGLEPRKLFLLPQKLWGFVFKTRTWGMVRTDVVVEKDMIDKLVMDPTRVKTLKALAGSYIRQNIHGQEVKGDPWNADFIQGKGQGQIILLHGKPGVGKTCTAECIAEYTKRPLMVLTSSDIGADPEKIERVLSDGFKTASAWGAVLLIDEADVFMEKRSTNDLNRNCLVAGFLRALEFYDGILFLTTNRVGAFDDAFISRIHVTLYFPDFNDKERQQIWQTFIDKLIKERGPSSGAPIRFRVSIDAKEFIKGREMKEVKWNGREIRNAFQTAVALAEYDAEADEEGNILLNDTHLRSIVDMSRDFKSYLDDTHGADEEKRAAMLQTRYDDRGEKLGAEL